MQTLEALVSLMVLVSILSYIVAEYPVVQQLDDSIYRYQLTNDVWRVLYLREDTRDIDMGSETNDRLVSDLGEIRQLTGLCVYVSGIRASSCPGMAADTRIGSVKKALYENGTLKVVTVTAAKSD